ncbi:MFS transporter [Kitasatospora sp. NPDC048545]|uniref:MFS transporter n=1 Tax=Kitasatospora sp. NPDC048545 TaxID=3157208 RepID=UPI0033EB49D6
MTSDVPSDGGRLRRAVAVLCLVQVLVALEFSIANVALPTLAQDFAVPARDLQWVLSGYALAYGSTLLCGGRFADVHGPRRTLLAGLACFSAASVAAALTPTFALLIVFRVAQGMAAAVATPAALALVTTLCTGPRRTAALAWWGAGASLGFAAGAALGGVLTQLAGWPAVFWACGLLAAVTAALARRLVPETPTRADAGPDVLGSLLLAVGAAAGITTLSLVPEASEHGWRVAGLAAASVGVGAVFLRRDNRRAAPLLPRRFLLRGPVLRANLAGSWAAAAGGSMVYFAASFMQHALGWSDALTGVALLPDAAAAALGARAAGPLHRRLGTTGACVTGLAAIAAGMALLAGTPLTGLAPAWVVAGTCLTGFGLVLVAVVTAVAATAELNADEHGVSGGLLITTQQLGVSLGLAVLLVAGQLAADSPLSVHGTRICLLAGGVLAALGCAAVPLLRGPAAAGPSAGPTSVPTADPSPGRPRTSSVDR